MTNGESLKDIRKALTWIDRRQIYGMVAALLGYGAWLFSVLTRRVLRAIHLSTESRGL